MSSLALLPLRQKALSNDCMPLDWLTVRVECDRRTVRYRTFIQVGLTDDTISVAATERRHN